MGAISKAIRKPIQKFSVAAVFPSGERPQPQRWAAGRERQMVFSGSPNWAFLQYIRYFETSRCVDANSGQD
jgi:hypothetical protein